MPLPTSSKFVRVRKMSDKFSLVKDFINSVGFPIFMSIVLIYLNMNIMENQNTIIKSLEKAIIESKGAINENNRLIAVLVTQIEKECK